MIDGCQNEKARELGALLARYYHQEQALVFDRNERGKSIAGEFSCQPAAGGDRHHDGAGKRKRRNSDPSNHNHDNVIWIVATDAAQREQAINLSSLLHGDSLHEEPGTTELIGDNDRAKAREIYRAILARAPAEVRELDSEMYSEQFNDLGLETAPAH